MAKRIVAAVGYVAVLCAVALAQNDLMARQNAVLEGVQISSEPSSVEGERIVTTYFIFRERPSSFFYEMKTKEKKLIFEFHDVKKGAAPIESVSEPPIKGFEVKEERIDVNAEIQGLRPEWHDVTKVVFDLEAVPIITVNEEYSVISFSYKWGTDPSRMDEYVQQEGKRKWWLIGSLAGVGLAGGAGVAIWLLTQEEPPASDDGPLDIEDLPLHQPQ
jgi:hypothetical protein